MLAHNSQKDDAKIQFKKLQKAEDGKKAMSEYEAEGVTMRAKTARLKALRVARDAADALVLANSPPVAPAKKKAAKGTKAKAKTGAKLSEWLDDQSKDGR